MSEWMGEVSKVNERDWGTKTLYSWQFKGTTLWFRCETDPSMEIGTCYRVSGDSPNKITTIQHIEPETLQKAVDQAPDTTDIPPTSSPDYWRWKQARDLEMAEYYAWKDARADATRIVCAALTQDILSLGATKGKRLDILVGMIKDTTTNLLEK